MNLSTFAQYYTHPMMGYDGWGWGFMMLFWTALIVLGVILTVRALNNGTSLHDSKPTPTPIDIINERYAKGEITKAQFNELKKDLSGH